MCFLSHMLLPLEVKSYAEVGIFNKMPLKCVLAIWQAKFWCTCYYNVRLMQSVVSSSTVFISVRFSFHEQSFCWNFCELMCFRSARCCGLAPVGSWAPPSCSLAPSGMGARIRKVEVQELAGWGKDSWPSKEKAVQASEAKQGITSLPPIGRQAFSHSRAAGPNAHT